MLFRSIPALATRRAETNIELGEGQSFVIAGLLDDRVTETLFRIPGLSHIPILGALFKSKEVNKKKTELVVLVTPEVVSPLQPGDIKQLPTFNIKGLPDSNPDLRKKSGQQGQP